jgi:CRISPR-associated endonuclease/helicase Cas3
MTLEDFQAFYSAIHHYPPFDWQVQLMRRVADEGWPATIALPTSSGKTSAIDLAVFHLALQAGWTMRDRDAALRTFFVIDRRVVVDEASEHAQKIATALINAQDGIVAEVAGRLRMYGGRVPLEVSTMRGGMYRDNSWADEPNQPLICVSTVDQTGSRLLFRGYQVGESSRPVHAGLIGNDSLVILDEAHLSTAFRNTLEALRERYMTWAKLPPAKPLRLVEMSATIPDTDTFRVDLASVARDSELGKRWYASKPVGLREPKKKFEDEMVTAAKELATGDGVSVVGVIANTVGAARSIFDKLPGTEKVLLIGRNRPHCAQKLWDRYKERIAAKKGRMDGGLLYVVATQTVEVGANIDFDALVTEAAPLDSLRQRFGRLNRLGKDGVAKAVIVRRKEDVIYGAATGHTWEFLKQHEPVDFGVVAMEAVVKDYSDLAQLNATRDAGPLLFPAHLEFWVQTNPTPLPDPEVAPFLHGRQALEAADVQVVWRADLGDNEKEWGPIVELAPPVATEALAMPVAAVRRWLRDQSEEIADIEGVAVAESEEKKPVPGRRVLRWRGVGKKSEVATAREIRPGDTIIVPTSYDGADEFGWNPSFTKTSDIGDDANNAQAEVGVRRPHYRVARLRGSLKDEDKAKLDSLIRQFLGSDEAEPDKSVAEEIGKLLPRTFAGAMNIDAEGGLISWPPQPRKETETSAPSEETDEGDESSFIGKKVRLHGHTKRVAVRARKYATGCGLAAEMVNDIVLAAENHDLGKRDERFQGWLYGNTFGGPDVLAKSGLKRTRVEDKRMREQAAYPAGARHECGSVIAAGADGILDGAHDRDLVLYLIGVHHGYGRPLFPVWEEPSPETASGWNLARIDSGWADRFWSLNSNYGYWGLAYLESILRRADCMESRWEEHHEPN